MKEIEIKNLEKETTSYVITDGINNSNYTTHIFHFFLAVAILMVFVGRLRYIIKQRKEEKENNDRLYERLSILINDYKLRDKILDIIKHKHKT